MKYFIKIFRFISTLCTASSHWGIAPFLLASPGFLFLQLFVMSVSSDFVAGDEPRSSTALRLAQSFRRASTATASSSAGSLQEEQQRRPTFGSIESARKSSFGGLPMLLKRSRTRAPDNVRGSSAAASQYATSICFSHFAD